MAPNDPPSRFKSRFSILSLLPSRHPPLIVSHSPMPPTNPGPSHHTVVSYSSVSPVHSEYPDPSTPLPPLDVKRKEKEKTPPAAKKPRRRPEPLDLEITHMMYPPSAVGVVIDPGTPHEAPPAREEAPPLPKKDRKKPRRVEDDPFEVAEVEMGHRYTSWKGGKVDIRPGEIIPRGMVPPLVSPGNDRKKRRDTTLDPDNYESVLHNVLLTPTYLAASPFPASSDEAASYTSRNEKRRTLLGKASDTLYSTAKRARDSLWMPGKGILKNAGGDGTDRSVRAMRAREEQEMDRFRRAAMPVRLVVPTRSTVTLSSGSSPSREMSHVYSRRSPGFVGSQEWGIGYDEDGKRPLVVGGDKSWRTGKQEEEKKRRNMMIWKVSIIMAILLLVALTVGLCTTLLRKSNSSSSSLDTSNSTDTSASSTATSSASSPSSTSSQTLTACLTQFASSAPSSPSSYPCSDCVPLLTSTTNDFSQPLVNGNSTGVGSALQFCAMIDVWNKVESGDGMSKWGTNASPCGWSGVSCDSRGRITGLSLQYPNVPTELPETLGNVYALQALHLFGNSSVPTGNFPSSLLSLPNFATLDLEYTALSGTISSAPFSKAAGLVTLVLVSNANLGTTMPDLSSNTKLMTVAVTGQSLTDAKADRLPSSLTYLDFSYNSLTGQIPSLSQLTALKTLYLQNNQFTSAPSSLPSSLTTLSFTSNSNLAGSMPDAVCSSTALTSCDLRSTSLTASSGTTSASSSVVASSSAVASSAVASSSVVASSTANGTAVESATASTSASGSAVASASASASASAVVNGAGVVRRADAVCGVCQFS
ncbi:hypothetical protein IAT38_006921 [Cryptococcus sp. DSM 104549]